MIPLYSISSYPQFFFMYYICCCVRVCVLPPPLSKTASRRGLSRCLRAQGRSSTLNSEANLAEEAILISSNVGNSPNLFATGDYVNLC